MLTNKTILITGANGGLGLALLKEALAHNAKKIHACVRTVENATALKALDPRVEIHSLVTTDHQSVQNLADSISEIDILINNAGVNSEKRVFEPCQSDFETNVFGTLNMCQAFENKIATNGAVITITSILALVNLPIMGLYSASKSALHSITQALRAEFALKQIDVYEAFPGPMDTKMSQNQHLDKAQPEDIAREIWAGYKAKRFEIYPDIASKGIKEGLLHDPEAVADECAKSLLA